ncbi:Nuclear transport factor 2, eukaryote,NTF2-like domain [Cinara cedri]|uniref:Nuclear transport factor 2, eukaryote,NTF2-like domain n=1 Tax=Cinara cedri TaxID=506608 RepID=A0A5E4MG56_9HEMI|nr:Nuclear transport factor 2, eukaryote,NTF2-like domain [Cinara cedri]
MADPTTITRNAALLGTTFAQHYYAVMRTTPEQADQFYDDSGEYQTVYEDCAAVIARTRQQVKKVLSRPMAASKLTVKSIFSVPYGGSVERLLVIVTGQSFMHVFVAEYRPKRFLNYVIVTSLTQYVNAEKAGDCPNLKTTLGAGDCRTDISTDRTPTACLKAKKQVGSSPCIPTYHEPFPNTVTDNVQPDIIIDNALFKFINNIKNPAEITISREPLPDTITDNTPTAGSKAKKHVRFASNIATYHEPIPDNINDNTQYDTVTEIPPIAILKRKSNPIEIATPPEPSTPNTVSINIHHNLVTQNPLTRNISSVPNPSQMSTLREPAPNAFNEKIQPNFATGKSQSQILKRVPTPPVIKNSRKPLSLIIDTHNTPLGLAKKKPPVQILNRVPNPTDVSSHREPSTPNTTTINMHCNLASRISPTRTLHHVPNPSEMTALRKPSSSNTVVGVGIDYAEPVTMRDNQSRKMRTYKTVSVFVWLRVTAAVHLNPSTSTRTAGSIASSPTGGSVYSLILINAISEQR